MVWFGSNKRSDTIGLAMAESVMIDRREADRRANPVCKTCSTGLNMTPLRRSSHSVVFRCPECGFTRSLAKPDKTAPSTDS